MYELISIELNKKKWINSTICTYATCNLIRVFSSTTYYY